MLNGNEDFMGTHWPPGPTPVFMVSRHALFSQLTMSDLIIDHLLPILYPAAALVTKIT